MQELSAAKRQLDLEIREARIIWDTKTCVLLQMCSGAATQLEGAHAGLRARPADGVNLERDLRVLGVNRAPDEDEFGKDLEKRFARAEEVMEDKLTIGGWTKTKNPHGRTWWRRRL